MNILIIEDDQLMLEGLVCALENEGYCVMQPPQNLLLKILY